KDSSDSNDSSSQSRVESARNFQRRLCCKRLLRLWKIFPGQPCSSRGEGWGAASANFEHRCVPRPPSPGLLCNPTSPRKRGEVKWDSCADSTQPHHALNAGRARDGPEGFPEPSRYRSPAVALDQSTVINRRAVVHRGGSIIVAISRPVAVSIRGHRGCSGSNGKTGCNTPTQASRLRRGSSRSGRERAPRQQSELFFSSVIPFF
ncbi:MAG: hypothetical protein QOJ15_7352, partial [Bradyrhizobium sp.]|nr:hypothetical protein [Bradyrhizobium sp.]